MLGLFYVILIVGWIILIVILKWRKGKAKRAMEQHLQSVARPQIHVIQIGSSLYDVIPISPNHQNYRCDCPEYNPPNFDIHHTNAGFMLDEEIVLPNHLPYHQQSGYHQSPTTNHNNNNNYEQQAQTPPPSYEEVMRSINAEQRSINQSDTNNNNNSLVNGCPTINTNSSGSNNNNINNPLSKNPHIQNLNDARSRVTITTPPNCTN